MDKVVAGPTQDSKDPHSVPESMRQSLRDLSVDTTSEATRRLSISQQQLPSTAQAPKKSGGQQVDRLLEQQVEKLLPQSTLDVVQDLKQRMSFDAISDSDDSDDLENSKEEKPWEVDVLQVGAEEAREA